MQDLVLEQAKEEQAARGRGGGRGARPGRVSRTQYDKMLDLLIACAWYGQVHAGHMWTNAELLRNAGIGEGWLDRTGDTYEDKVGKTNREIEEAKKRYGGLTGEQQYAANAWKGELAQLMERRENLTDADIDAMSRMVWREILYSIGEAAYSKVKDTVIRGIAEAHDVETEDVMEWLRANRPSP